MMNDEDQGTGSEETTSSGQTRQPRERDESPHFADDLLSAFSTGRVDALTAERIEAHLLECDECGARLDSLIRSDSLINRLRGGDESSDTDVTSSEFAITPGVTDRSSAREAAAHSIGKAFRNHRLIAILGSGGMGVVYRARDSLIERDVALKVLHESVARDPVSRARFLAEARAQGQLNHRNIVTIYSIDELESTMYIVMELLPGGSMADRVKRRGPASYHEATRALMHACRGLAAAHAAGLIHRDIKPENLLLDAEGNVKLGDFGLAKALDAVSMTQPNHLVGTPQFMSPEQCRCEQIDSRSDIYQIGATYYSLLTGTNPYPQATTPLQAINAHCNLPVPDPREVNAAIPDECAAFIMHAMAKDADDRYQSADEAFADLLALHETLLAGETEQTRVQKTALPKPERAETARRRIDTRPRVALFVLLLVATLAIAGYFHQRGGSRGRDGESESVAAVPAADNTIKVGILHSLSGTMADSESPVVDAALLAIDELNDAGGLLGRKIEAIVADGRSDPVFFAEQAERLITQEKVCVVFGCWTSASRRTVIPVFERHDHLLVYPVQYEGLEQSPNVIYTGATPNQQLIPAVKWAFAFEGKRRFFLVGSDYVFPRAAHEIMKDEIAELGAQVVGEEYVPLGSSDVEGAVEDIVAAEPDVILNTINGDSNVAFFRALRARGISPDEIPTISFSIGEVELRHLDFKQMIGDYACWTYFQTIDDPVNERFVQRFRRKYGPQRVVTDPMEASYFSIKLWAQAVVNGNDIEVSVTRPGMCGREFRAPQGRIIVNPVTQHTLKTPRIGRVRADGQFDIVWEAAPAVPVPYPSSRSRDEWDQFLNDLYQSWGGQWSSPLP